MNASSDSSRSETEGEEVRDMQQYQDSVIHDLEGSDEEIQDEDIDAKIEALKSAISLAEIEKKSKKIIKRYQDELDELEIKKMLPKKVDVNIDRSVQDTSITTNEEEMDLSNFWHYKVMHTDFVGEDSINLTNDDSDEGVYLARTSFIDNYCAKSSEYEIFDNQYKIPKPIWQSLFPHQRYAIKWLWGLYHKKAGGIEGDEMGLGKTAIASVFIGGLIQSGLINKPVLVLCPLTVTQQWIRELHIWVPNQRAILLHTTRTNKNESLEDLLRASENTTNIIVTNYDTLLKMHETYSLQMVDWSCIICDEAHKIRNHETSLSKLVKLLTADFRLAVTGSPIQNNLLELWSLFDFVYPGLLGALDVFEKDFATPIKLGSYSNARSFEVFRAYTAAVALMERIKPYLLRRMKKDVQANLPTKSEQIFFVKLGKAQRQLYREFLDSKTVRDIKAGNGEVFAGITLLRKICNHPCLYDDQRYSEDWRLSSKLALLHRILPVWSGEGHRALLFSQSLTMLNLCAALLKELGLDFFRMDGETAAAARVSVMDRFNSGERFACLLSTKVGGIGVNLMGADRVVIIDPDWNPSTDLQALERAYRIGQTKHVSVYRLICSGTIEEKMYKKQIFKTFLSNKIMQNPNQRRLFQPSTVGDLFALDEDGDDELLGAQEEVADDDRSGAEEDSNEDDNEDDKALMKGLIEGGDSIVRVFKHDELFGGELKEEDLIARNQAKVATREATRKLDRSVPKKVEGSILVDRLRARQADNMDTVTGKVVAFLKARGGKASTNDIISHFRNTPEVRGDPELVRTILHHVSVFNRRLKTWFLMGRYK